MTKRDCETFFALILERAEAGATTSVKAIATACRDCLADERYARERRELVGREEPVT